MLTYALHLCTLDWIVLLVVANMDIVKNSDLVFLRNNKNARIFTIMKKKTYAIVIKLLGFLMNLKL